MSDPSGGARRWLPTGALLAALLGVGVAVVTRWRVTASVDREVADSAFHLTAAHPWLAHAALLVQALFSTAPMIGYVAVAAVVLGLAGHRRTALLAVAAMVSTAVATTALKLAVDRARPHWAHPLTTLASPSFPSGHSSSIAAAAAVAVLAAGLLAGRRLRRAVDVVAAVLALVVGADRLLLGVHYLTDVVAGYLLGTAVVLALWRAAASDRLRAEPR